MQLTEVLLVLEGDGLSVFCAYVVDGIFSVVDGICSVTVVCGSCVVDEYDCLLVDEYDSVIVVSSDVLELVVLGANVSDVLPVCRLHSLSLAVLHVSVLVSQAVPSAQVNLTFSSSLPLLTHLIFFN